MVICGLLVSTIFFHIIHTILEKKKCYPTQIVCFDFLYDLYLKQFPLQEEMSEI